MADFTKLSRLRVMIRSSAWGFAWENPDSGQITPHYAMKPNLSFENWYSPMQGPPLITRHSSIALTPLNGKGLRMRQPSVVIRKRNDEPPNWNWTMDKTSDHRYGQHGERTTELLDRFRANLIAASYPSAIVSGVKLCRKCESQWLERL